MARVPAALLPLAVGIELSDILDGFAARRTEEVSVIGGVYDSMADHVARMTAFISLLALGVVGPIVVIVFLWRDGVVGTLRLVALITEKRPPVTRISGKWKGVTQGTCLIWLAMTQSAPESVVWSGSWITQPLVWLAVVVTGASGADYMWAHREMVLRTLRRPVGQGEDRP